jgi:hypothetical protein
MALTMKKPGIRGNTEARQDASALARTDRTRARRVVSPRVIARELFQVGVRLTPSPGNSSCFMRSCAFSGAASFRIELDPVDDGVEILTDVSSHRSGQLLRTHDRSVIGSNDSSFTRTNIDSVRL